MNRKLIDVDALLKVVDENIELSERLKTDPRVLDAVRIFRGLVVEQAIVKPQVIINVTGGVAEVIAADYPVDINILDYDIVDNEQGDYIIDEDGDQAWLYGDSATVDPELVDKILHYRTVGGDEDEEHCSRCDDEITLFTSYSGMCLGCAS